MWPKKEHSKVSGGFKGSIDQLNQGHENIGPLEGTARSRDVRSSRPANLKVKRERNEYEMKPGSGKTVDHSERWTKEDLLCINQCRSVDNRFLFEIFDGKLIHGVNVFYS